MGKIIYLISVLSGLKVVSVVLLIATCSISIPIVSGYFRAHLEGYEEEKKTFKRIIGSLCILLIIFTIISISIPTKKEMYAITLTKEYELQDISKMSKKEIQSAVGYIFEKMEELKDKD